VQIHGGDYAALEQPAAAAASEYDSVQMTRDVDAAGDDGIYSSVARRDPSHYDALAGTVLAMFVGVACVGVNGGFVCLGAVNSAYGHVNTTNEYDSARINDGDYAATLEQ
jgi:hypothetical protein